MAPAAARPEGCSQGRRQREQPTPSRSTPETHQDASLKRSTGNGGSATAHPDGLASQPAVESTPVVQRE
eukprot:12577979-Alexandrium_andersonii.AAC.1